MKRAIQIGLIVVLIGCFLIPGIPEPRIVAGDCNPEAVVQIHAPWIGLPWWELYGHYDPVDYVAFSSCWGSVFQAQVRVTKPRVSVYLKKYPNFPSEEVEITVWHVAWNGEETAWCHIGDDPVISKTISSAGWESNVWRWVTAVNDNGILSLDEYYSIEIKVLDDDRYIIWASSEDPYYFPFEGCACNYDPECYGVSDQGCGVHYMGAMVQGCWSPPINVLTQDGYVSQNGNIVMGGLVTSLGTTGTVECYIDYGFTEELGNVKFVKKIDTVTPPGSYYNWQLTSWPGGSLLYFRARIVETESGEVGYGLIKEVFVPTVIPQISCDVVVNDAWNCTFETIINSIDDVEAVDLVLYYGTNWSCMGTPGSVTMFEDVDEAGVFRWDDINWGIFKPGLTYYYYAEEQTTENATIVRSQTKQFKRFDPNIPAWRNWVEDWMAGLWGTADLPEINGWWILAVVVFLLVFFLTTRARNWKLGLAWGMIAMMVLLYVLVANDLVNPWLVVLLSILAAYIVYKFVFAPVMHK